MLPTDTSICVDQVRVVGDDGVTAVLGDDADGDNNGKPPAITSSLEEVHIVSGLVNLLLNPESLPDFAVFELDGKIVLVAIGVPLGQGLQRLVVAVLGDQPSGRLGQSFGKCLAKLHPR